jgi:hypothetical protein
MGRFFVGPMFLSTLAVATVSLAACGGGGSSPTPVAAASSQPGSGSGSGSSPGAGTTAVVKLIVTWPQGSSTSSSTRHRNYVSNSTASISVSVNGGTPIYANNPNLSPGTGSAGTQSTTVLNVTAPVGGDTFTVGDYDAANGTGNLLAQNSIPFTVIYGANQTVGVTLNGNLGKIVCAPITPFVTGANGGPFTLVGPTGQVALLPEDPDGNVIIAPGALPALSISAPASAATTSTTSTTNEFNVDVLTSGATVTLTGSGNNLAGIAVSGTCTITRTPALYVTNYSQTGQNPSVTIYPASASGDATPVATLAGPATLESGLQFAAVDPAGNLFLTNLGPVPGATYGPTSGYVTEYSPGTGQTGNAAPVATITGFNRPEGIQFDSTGNLYVLSLDRIQEYPPTANGLTAPAAVSSSIVGADTQITTCYGLDVTTTTIYATCVPYPFYIAYWPKATSGNVAPTQMEFTGAVTTMGVTASYSEVSWLGIAVDPTSGTMYTPDANNNINEVYSFLAGASGMTAPTALASGFTQPIGIFEDASGKFYVANYGANSISVFSSATTLTLGTVAASATISGADTGLNYPYGVTVR